MLNALSVDVEDYFHVENLTHRITRDDWDSMPLRVEDSTLRLLDMFDSHGARATFFTLGWVAERCPDLVKEIHRRGHEIGCHSHLHRLIFNLEPEEFRADTLKCKTLLEDLIGEPVVGYRAPSYSITTKNLWALDVLAELGFVYDSSIFPVRHDRYGIPNFHRWPVADLPTPKGHRIHEFPLTTFRMGNMNMPAAGGGYLRLLPPQWTRHGVQSANRAGRPAILYIHPWEIDDGQPRVEGLGRLKQFRCYHNLDATFDRLEDLVRRFQWGTVREVLAQTLQRPDLEAA
ncbi:MAG: XrtA system polysaccharide deacetylase [Bradymonadia bacterium]